MNPLALISHPLSVNNPHLVYPRSSAFLEVIVQKGWNLLRGEGVKIDTVLNRNPYCILGMVAPSRHSAGSSELFSIMAPETLSSEYGTHHNYHELPLPYHRAISECKNIKGVIR
jgi:hypothetical protein